MIYILALLVICFSVQGQTLEELDREYRAQVMAVLPEDYAAVSADVLLEEVAAAAENVYAPHAAMLRDLAKERLASIPEAPADMLESLVLVDSLDLESMELMEPLVFGEDVNLNGYLYALRLWEPQTVAGMAKTLALARFLSPSRLGGRMMVERALPDSYYLLEQSPEDPTIAIASLRDVVTVELHLQDSGCYLPTGVSLYRVP